MRYEKRLSGSALCEADLIVSTRRSLQLRWLCNRIPVLAFSIRR